MHVFVLSLAVLLVWLYAEVALLLYVSQHIGLLSALALTFVTGAVGFAIVRAQGWKILGRARTELDRGVLPVEHLLDGLILFGAGVMLITPGLITDVLGALLLIPFLRRLVLWGLVRWWKRRAVTIHSASPPRRGMDIVHDDGVIDSIVVERHEDRPQLGRDEENSSSEE